MDVVGHQDAKREIVALSMSGQDLVSHQAQRLGGKNASDRAKGHKIGATTLLPVG
jgi:hypothetical protein